MKDKFDDINNDLLVKYLLHETSNAESTLVERWIGEEASNRQYFENFKLIWDESRQFAYKGTVGEEEAWQRLHKRIHKPAGNQAVVRQLQNKFKWTRVAVLIIFIAAIAWLTKIIIIDSPPQNIVLQARENVLQDTLPDGSLVTLNKNSKITYPGNFKGGTRKLVLQGEAFFNITPDKHKPFIVHINDVTVRVVGTSFNIRSRNGKTEVIVESGIVQVQKQDRSVTLVAKEKLTVDKSDSTLVKDEVTDKLYNHYRTREFVCDNTPLWKLVEVLNEAYQVQILIERKELRTLPLTTEFNNESLDNILNIISQTFDISVTRSGNNIILK